MSTGTWKKRWSEAYGNPGQSMEGGGKAKAKRLRQQCARCVQTTAGRPKLSTWSVWKIRKLAFQVTPLGNMDFPIDIFTK